MDDIAATRRNLILTMVAGSVLSSSAVRGQDGAKVAQGPAGQFTALSGRIATPAAFGAKGDMTTDDTAALQACLDTGLPVIIPEGRFRITRALQVKPGQIVAGLARVGSGTGAAIVNTVPGGGCLWYTQDTATGQQPMPMIANLFLSADFPIRFNDPERGQIGDGPRSNIPYGMVPLVRGCRIVARDRGTGTGIAWTKMFDGVIEECQIEGFSTNILLQGCDLNAVRHNRSVLASRYHVLDLSVSSFGSQNIIEHNDLLQAGSDACIFVKSSGRHARIRDNYLEHGFTGASDASVRSFTGFIDASSVDAPHLGVNGGGERFTTIVANNRIDGVKYARDFVYRYEPAGQTWGEIVDPGTTGEPVSAGAAYLKLVDQTGRDIDAVPFLFNEINTCAFAFRSPGFGCWNGYATNTDPVSTIDGTNCSMFGPVLFGDQAHRFVMARGNRIVVLNGLPSRASFSFASNDERFVSGHRYRYVLTARTVAGQETLTIGALGAGGGAPQSFPLSPRFARLSWETTVPAASPDRQGFYLERSNNGQAIEIERIEIVKCFADELPRIEGASAMLALTGTEGEIVVEAEDGQGRRAMAVYRLVQGHLQPLFARSDDEAALSIRANWRSPNIGVAIVGSATRKAIHIGRTSA